MATYAGGCSVSVTLTPTTGGGMTYAGSASVSVNISPRPGGALYQTYTDTDGMLQPVYLTEWYRGRKVEQVGRTQKFSRVFFIHGTFEPADCLDLGPQVGDADDVLPDFIVQNRKLEMYAKGGGESNIVKLEVDYQKPETPQSSGGDVEATFSFEFSSQSVHVDTAINQENYPETSVEAGEDLLINFDGETVDGLEIDAPILELTETHTYTESEFSPAFRQQLAAAVKKTNAEAWREYEPESVLFDGASARKINKTWHVTFRFRIQRGFTAKVFSIVNSQGEPENVSVDKPGWHYFWIRMQKRGVGNPATAFRVVPSSIHVAQVYETLDFATLGIGVQSMN